MSLFEIFKSVAGLGLFLYGMSLLESALQALSGRSTKRFLQKHTSRPFAAVLNGAIATALLQSSSVVSLMVLALVGAGVLKMTNAIGIILGSNLGTTATGWIVTLLGFKLNISLLTIPTLAAGTMIHAFFSNQKSLLKIANLFIGFSFLFMGLDFMKESMTLVAQSFDVEALKEYPYIAYFFFGLILTALIQSSSATMMITLSALHVHILELHPAIAIVIGADLGTTITVLFGALKGSAAKKRVALSHLSFNLFTAIVALILLIPHVYAIQHILKISDPLFILVFFHSSFNLLGILCFLPFIQTFTRFLERFFKNSEMQQNQFLKDIPPSATEEAVEALKRESENLLSRALRLNARMLGIKLSGPPERILKVRFIFPLPQETISESYENLKKLEGEIISYLHKLGTTATSAEPLKTAHVLATVRNAIHSCKCIKDIHPNFKDFKRSADTQIILHQEQFMKGMQELYSDFLQILGPHAPSLVEESKQNIQRKIEQFHENEHKEILDASKNAGLGETEISTLFNVNRELYLSNKSLLRAFENYLNLC